MPLAVGAAHPRHGGYSIGFEEEHALGGGFNQLGSVNDGWRNGGVASFTACTLSLDCEEGSAESWAAAGGPGTGRSAQQTAALIRHKRGADGKHIKELEVLLFEHGGYAGDVHIGAEHASRHLSAKSPKENPETHQLELDFEAQAITPGARGRARKPSSRNVILEELTPGVAPGAGGDPPVRLIFGKWDNQAFKLDFSTVSPFVGVGIALAAHALMKS